MANLTHADICLPDFLPDGGTITAIVGFISGRKHTVFIDFIAVAIDVSDDPYGDYCREKIAELLNKGATHIVFRCLMPDDKEETIFLNHLFLT